MMPFSRNILSGATDIPAMNNPKGFGVNRYRASSDASLFSCSLPVLPHANLNSVEDDLSSEMEQIHLNIANGDDPIEDVRTSKIGTLFPDDEDELLAGIADDLDLSGLPCSLDDMEDDDVFDSGGGMELEQDAHENHRVNISNLNVSDGNGFGNGMPQFALANGMGAVAGEHPYGEHPSRTLFVRNINSNVEDSELKILFEQYGDIRSLYTACKHRGFVMITYYDIRDARTAMRALQNKPLRRRKLDIHFSIPKDNPSDKDVNQGTLVVFNLDPAVSNEDLRQIFGTYGEVKEIRETPQKKHHKFVEYYDARAAEAALKSLNRSEIAGKRIKLEPSRPGGARRSLMLNLNQEPEQEESRNFRNPVGSPIAISPPGNWMKYGSPIEYSTMNSMSKSPVLTALSPSTGNHLPGLAALLHPQLSNNVKAPIGNEQLRATQMDHILKTKSMHGSPSQQSHSFSDLNLTHFHNSPISTMGSSVPNVSRVETLSGPQFLWGSPKPTAENGNSAWTRPVHHGSFVGSAHSHHLPHHHHHVGSAPSGVPLQRQYGFFPESPETSFLNPSVYQGMSLGCNDGKLVGNMAHQRAGISSGIPFSESGSSSFGIMSSPRLSPVFLGNGLFPVMQSRSIDGFAENARMRRVENNGNLGDSKKQFQLDLEKIIKGEDSRTTLMIKNIPNKYTSKMLLAAIDENHQGTYDFLYLPIDFKNKCNVGYAFINMLSPTHIIPFYKAFNGKKWEKFNSEKVALLAYARIQGKTALVTHFQNSSLMNEDKRCRPILFYSEGSDACDEVILQEHLLSNSLNIHVSRPNGSISGGSSSSPTEHNPFEVPEKS